MQFSYITPEAVTENVVFLSSCEMEWPVVCRPAPAVDPLRRARRTYTESELSTAAVMLEKLRRQMDLSLLPRIVDAEMALDAAADKLLDVLQLFPVSSKAIDKNTDK